MRVDPIEFLSHALQHEGAPYIWGAKGPDAFDCSGLVTFCIWACGGPNWRQDYNCAKLFATLEPADMDLKSVPLNLPEGLLVFYGPPGKPNHCMLTMPDGRVYGACGGGRQTTVATKGACVQFRPSPRYRPDVLGVRKLPEALH